MADRQGVLVTPIPVSFQIVRTAGSGFSVDRPGTTKIPQDPLPMMRTTGVGVGIDRQGTTKTPQAPLPMVRTAQVGVGIDRPGQTWKMKGGSFPNEGLVLIRRASEVLSAVDHVDLNSAFTRTGGDTASSQDGAQKNLGFTRTLDDQATATDALAKVVDYQRLQADLSEAVDALAKVVDYQRADQDTTEAVDTFSKVVGYLRKRDDLASTAETLVTVVNYNDKSIGHATATDHGELQYLTSRLGGVAYLDAYTRMVTAMVGFSGSEKFVLPSSDCQIYVDLLQAEEPIESFVLDPHLGRADNTWMVSFGTPAPNNFVVRVRIEGTWKAGFVHLPVVRRAENSAPSILTTVRRPR